MDETYRMLGREHQADLEREADRHRRAEVGRGGVAPAPGREVTRGRKRAQLVFARVTALMSRAARAGA
jgi:hypothetical protein